MSKPSVAELIADGLVRHGVRVMFSQSLPSAVILAAQDRGIAQISYRTENAGTAMADGFARVSGRVGVVTAQNGAAATLLVPGLAEAMKVSIPVLALVQDVHRNQTDRNAFQEYDHVALLSPVTKWVRRVTEADRVEDYLDMAFANAVSGRPGPVALILPPDLLNETVSVGARRRASLGRFPIDRSVPEEASIAEAVELLAHAKNPILVAGGGVHISDASKEVARLQSEAHIPVVTTVMGKGSVDERHPLTIGIAGYAMGKLAPARHLRPMFDEADVVLLVGTRTNQNGTDSWSLYPDGARYIHIDVDGGELGRNYEALRLAGDARATLQVLADRLAGRRQPDPAIIKRIERARMAHLQDIAPLKQSDATPLRPERIMAEVEKLMGDDVIVVSDASYSTLWTACYLTSRYAGSRFISPRGLAGLGWGLPLALGAKVASPDSSVIVVVGDGGFAHVWSELETSIRMGLKVVVIVLNNGVLGYQKDAEDLKFGRHTAACYFQPVDHAAIARACGCAGSQIHTADDLAGALQVALGANQTTVLDVITDPAAYPPVTFFDPLDETRVKLGH